MFNKRLVELRKKQNLSQYELAERLGFSRGKIANYEQGTREPDFDTLKQLADYFEVSTDDLLGRSFDKNKPDDDQAAFEKFLNNPSLEVFYKELPKSDEEEIEQLREFWEFIKSKKK